MMAFPCRLFNKSVQKMFSSFPKLFRIAVAHRKAFSSMAELAEFQVHSFPAVMSPDFKYFDILKCYPTDWGKGWADFRDRDGVDFRMARYEHPSEGYVSVHSGRCNREDHSTAAAVKRSDQGLLLNSCVMCLGSVDALTAEAEGALLGLLISDADEKVQLCLDSWDLIMLLGSRSPSPPKSCEDLIFNMRSMIETKKRNRGILELQKTDRIANFLPQLMAQGWASPIRSPTYFGCEQLLPQELKNILYEDICGHYRFAKK